jgi:hypothetical protein
MESQYPNRQLDVKIPIGRFKDDNKYGQNCQEFHKHVAFHQW